VRRSHAQTTEATDDKSVTRRQ